MQNAWKTILYYSTRSRINIYEYLVFFTETTDSDSASHHSYHRDDKGNYFILQT